MGDQAYMSPSSIDSRLGVCSWSLRPESPAELLADLKTIGTQCVQLALDPLRAEPGIWSDCGRRLESAGIAIGSGMVACVGEDYTTISSIHRTGGVVPDETWPQTLANMKASAALAQKLGIRLVTFHAGFIPAAGPALDTVLSRITESADVFAAHGCQIALETGQESAQALVHFLMRLDRDDVGVNFDPANMILYGSGDPIAALRRLRPFVKQVHIKDATASANPGVDWGDEVVAGTGQVDWQAFFGLLRDTNYLGHLMIEREAGPTRVADIAAAREFVRKIA